MLIEFDNGNILNLETGMAMGWQGNTSSYQVTIPGGGIFRTGKVTEEDRKKLRNAVLCSQWNETPEFEAEDAEGADHES